ncbi:YidH family protein [Hazenella coriacea]|uniref:Putative membrane protein n=1 Tax=Hazenella coriacea TaxID=1179467 RepID=A0A4V2UVD4_9BACL|nr:DUF202 domain-containing protein [Hazenella coriacea]TCS94737.1 putative membrane protein [Hazenella coriacea]
MDSQQPSHESKYIQQHLANERTYLAWVRTAIATIGLGFVAARLHLFSPLIVNQQADLFAQFIGLGSIILGLIIIIYTTIDYLRKRKTINEQTFTTSVTPIWLYSIGTILLGALFFIYLLFF